MTPAMRAQKNRRLAELLGWRVEQRAVSPLYRIPGNVAYDLYSPQGKRMAVSGDGGEAGAWQYAPDFYGSMDACWRALPDDMHVMMIWEADDLYYCRLWRDGMGDEDGWRMDGDTRTEAFAEALLSYAEAQQNEEAGT